MISKTTLKQKRGGKQWMAWWSDITKSKKKVFLTMSRKCVLHFDGKKQPSWGSSKKKWYTKNIDEDIYKRKIWMSPLFFYWMEEVRVKFDQSFSCLLLAFRLDMVDCLSRKSTPLLLPIFDRHIRHKTVSFVQKMWFIWCPFFVWGRNRVLTGWWYHCFESTRNFTFRTLKEKPPVHCTKNHWFKL